MGLSRATQVVCMFLCVVGLQMCAVRSSTESDQPEAASSYKQYLQQLKAAQEKCPGKDLSCPNEHTAPTPATSKTNTTCKVIKAIEHDQHGCNPAMCYNQSSKCAAFACKLASAGSGPPPKRLSGLAVTTQGSPTSPASGPTRLPVSDTFGFTFNLKVSTEEAYHCEVFPGTGPYGLVLSLTHHGMKIQANYRDQQGVVQKISAGSGIVSWKLHNWYQVGLYISPGGIRIFIDGAEVQDKKRLITISDDKVKRFAPDMHEGSGEGHGYRGDGKVLASSGTWNPFRNPYGTAPAQRWYAYRHHHRTLARLWKKPAHTIRCSVWNRGHGSNLRGGQCKSGGECIHTCWGSYYNYPVAGGTCGHMYDINDLRYHSKEELSQGKVKKVLAEYLHNQSAPNTFSESCKFPSSMIQLTNPCDRTGICGGAILDSPTCYMMDGEGFMCKKMGAQLGRGISILHVEERRVAHVYPMMIFSKTVLCTGSSSNQDQSTHRKCFVTKRAACYVHKTPEQADESCGNAGGNGYAKGFNGASLHDREKCIHNRFRAEDLGGKHVTCDDYQLPVGYVENRNSLWEAKAAWAQDAEAFVATA